MSSEQELIQTAGVVPAVTDCVSEQTAGQKRTEKALVVLQGKIRRDGFKRLPGEKAFLDDLCGDI